MNHWCFRAFVLAASSLIPAGLMPAAERQVVVIALRTQPDAASVRDGVGIGEACVSEQDELARRLQGAGGRVIYRYRSVNALAVEVPRESLASIRGDAAVTSADFDRPMRGNLDVSTAAAGAPAYWSSGLTGAGQAVALIDSGVDAMHPAFSGAKIVHGPVFSSAWPAGVSGQNTPDDLTALGHGTQLAGIIVGQGSSGFARHVGMAPAATLYNLKAAYQTSQNEAWMPGADMLAALDYAVLHTPAKIVNISFSLGLGNGMQGYDGGDTGTILTLMENIVQNYGIALVTSAAVAPGFASGTPVAPATLRNGIAVGAMDDRNTVSRADDTLSPTNATGPTNAGVLKPDLTAPGVSILAPASQWEGVAPDYVTMNEQFEYRSPSAAAAHVSGALALLRQSGVTDMLLAKAILINSADGSGSGAWTPNGGWGYLNLWNAREPGSYFRNRHGIFAEAFAGPLESGPLNITLANYRDALVHVIVSDRRTGLPVYSKSVSGGAAKVSLPNGYYLIQVDPLKSSAEYALAISQPGFEPVKIARVGGENSLTYSCFGNKIVALGSKYSITCTVTNPGDVEAHQVTARGFTHVGGSGGGEQLACDLNFGAVAGHGTRTQSCLATATRPGPQQVCATFSQLQYHNPDPEYQGTSRMACYDATVTGAGITGRVTLQANGQPLEGVFVALTGPAQRSNKTDANGAFGLYELQPGSGPYTITPSKDGYTFTPASAVVATIPAGQVPVVAFTATLRPPANGLRVRAFIDGRSRLILRGNTAQWQHIDWAAPGRHGGLNLPTILNQVSWTPTWPAPVPNEIRFEALSSVFTGIQPPVVAGATYKLRPLAVREGSIIVQQPAAGNGNTLVVEFNDNASSGPEWYELDLCPGGCGT